MTIPDLGSSLPEIVIRTTIVYLFIVLVLRIAGKREVGQFSIFELIVVLVISDAVQNSMVGENTTVWGGLVAVLTLLAMDVTLRALSRRIRPLRIALEGEPRLLIRDGKLLEKAIREEKIGVDDVMVAIRRNGLELIKEVRLAVLETDGTISIIPMSKS
jgi:uncharacterized membrane protein YcaP (DUF421 family)